MPQAEFYDVKARKKVKAEVVEKTTYGQGSRIRYALKGKTADGRSLTLFVSKKQWDSIKLK